MHHAQAFYKVAATNVLSLKVSSEQNAFADAILDRLVNSSHRIDLKGESLRKGILKNE
jgi:hypothetical protein